MTADAALQDCRRHPLRSIAARLAADFRGQLRFVWQQFATAPESVLVFTITSKLYSLSRGNNLMEIHMKKYTGNNPKDVADAMVVHSND